MIDFGGYLIKQFGSYIRTDLTGLTDVNGVASGIIGMIGLAEKGPVNEPVEITSYTQLVDVFGDGPLVRHGLASYVGGANRIIAVRIGEPEGASLTAIAATSGGTTSEKDYTWEAREKGTIGNNISVSVSDDDEEYRVTVKYLDSRGNDIREVFVFPSKVPNPVTTNNGTTSYRYYDGNTDDYFVLRDRETGVIREVPTSWDFGNEDLDAFVEKVDQLKSMSEDLVGPFSFGGEGTEHSYPIPLISTVINVGGLDQAPSELIQLREVDPVITDFLYESNPATYDSEDTATDVLVPHPFVNLSGGDNGDDGTNYYGTYDSENDTWDYNATYDVGGSSVLQDSWGEGLSLLESEDVNFVQPAYLFNYERNTDGTLSNTYQWDTRYGFFKSLMPLFISHVNLMSNIPNRKFRTSVVGLPYYKKGSTTENGTAQDFLDATVDISGVVNNDRFQLWAGGFRSSAFSSGIEEYGADMLASFVVGSHAAREVSVSLTFSQFSGIFTDGLEFNFNTQQKDELYTRRHAFTMKRRNSAGATEFIAAHNYTSFVGASNRGLQLFITRRIVDYMNTFVYKNLEENFVGRKARGAQTASRISTYVNSLLSRLVREDVLVAFANLRAFADENDPTVYYVEYDFQPVTEIDFIPVTNKLLYNLA